MTAPWRHKRFLWANSLYYKPFNSSHKHIVEKCFIQFALLNLLLTFAVRTFLFLQLSFYTSVLLTTCYSTCCQKIKLYFYFSKEGKQTSGRCRGMKYTCQSCHYNRLKSAKYGNEPAGNRGRNPWQVGESTGEVRKTVRQDWFCVLHSRFVSISSTSLNERLRPITELTVDSSLRLSVSSRKEAQEKILACSVLSKQKKPSSASCPDNAQQRACFSSLMTVPVDIDFHGRV